MHGSSSAKRGEVIRRRYWETSPTWSCLRRGGAVPGARLGRRDAGRGRPGGPAALAGRRQTSSSCGCSAGSEPTSSSAANSSSSEPSASSPASRRRSSRASRSTPRSYPNFSAKTGTVASMLRALAAVVLGLAAALGVAPLAASAAQPLVVDVTEAGSQVRNLAVYDLATPVAMRVIAPLATDAAVLAVDPFGGSQRFALTRASDGAWTGPVALGTAGTWTLSVATTGPHGHTSTTPPFAVQAEHRLVQVSPEMLGVLACVSIAGGLGLIGVGRRVDRHSVPNPDEQPPVTT